MQTCIFCPTFFLLKLYCPKKYLSGKASGGNLFQPFDSIFSLHKYLSGTNDWVCWKMWLSGAWENSSKTRQHWIKTVWNWTNISAAISKCTFHFELKRKRIYSFKYIHKYNLLLIHLFNWKQIDHVNYCNFVNGLGTVEVHWWVGQAMP